MAEPATDPETSPRPIGPTIRFFLLLALGAWLIRSLVVAPFSIPSGSMLPTMAIGDYLFVAKWPYGYSRYSFPFQLPPFDGRVFGRLPERGDVVIFKKPGEEIDWVKRVIGLPGDRIAVDDGRVIINGRLVPRTGEGMVGVPVSPNSPCRVAAGATPDVVVDNGESLRRYPVFRERLPDGPLARRQLEGAVRRGLPGRRQQTESCAVRVPPHDIRGVRRQQRTSVCHGETRQGARI